MQSDQHKASVSELFNNSPACAHLFVRISGCVLMHTYLIWGFFALWGHAETPVLATALQTSVVPNHVTGTSQNVPPPVQCHGESSVHDAAKPSHPMAGRALNAQLFVAELQFSLLPPSLCRTNWSKCRSCHMYNKAQSHWAENIQCFQKSLCALRG